MLTLSMGSAALEALEAALQRWNNNYNSIFSILTTSPEEFRGGTMWNTASLVFDILQGVGVALLLIFFFYGLFKTTVSYTDYMRNPTQLIFMFLPLFVANFFVLHTKELLLSFVQWTSLLITKLNLNIPFSDLQVPETLATALRDADFWSGTGAILAAWLGSAVIWLLSIILLVVVYARFFKIFLLTAFAPLPLSAFASKETANLGKNFVKAYAAECLRGILILIACSLFSAFIVSPEVSGDTPGKMTWMYVGEMAMYMLLLVIVVKESDRMVKEVSGL